MWECEEERCETCGCRRCSECGDFRCVGTHEGCETEEEN